MKDWRVVVNVLLGIAAVVMISVFGATTAGIKPYDPNSMAAWLQAVGSIAAILGAFALARNQRQHDQLEKQHTEHRELQELSKAVELLVEDARAAIEESTRKILEHRDGKIFSAPTDRLEAAQYGLRVLIEKQLPSPLLVAVIILQRHVTYAIRALQDRNGISTFISDDSKGKANSRDEAAREECSRVAGFRLKIGASWGESKAGQ